MPKGSKTTKPSGERKYSKNGKSQKGRPNRARPKTDGADISAKDVIQSSTYEAIKYDASSIFFSNIVGSLITRVPGSINDRLPGVMTFEGRLNTITRSDLVNVSATSIYTFIRHANAGRTNYEASDYMVYLLSMSEVYVHLVHIMRAYGIASYFEARNLNSGLLVEALGFDPAVLRGNLANVRYSINLLINKLKAFAVPRAFAFFDERISEFARVYLDEPDVMAQYYAIIPGELGQFDALSPGGSGLKFDGTPVKSTNIMSYLTNLNDVVDAIRANEDVNIMSGDTLKAYGDNLYLLEPIGPEFIVIPEHDELFLMQIQNAHIIPEYTSYGNIIQTSNKLSQQILIDTTDIPSDPDDTFLAYDNPRYLNSTIEAVDANLIFSLSKYQITAETNISNGDLVGLDLTSGNTTILSDVKIWSYDNAMSPGVSSTTQTILLSNSLPGVVQALIAITKFRLHPYIYMEGISKPIGDMHYVALLSGEDTMRMNDARFLLNFQTLQMA